MENLRNYFNNLEKDKLVDVLVEVTDYVNKCRESYKDDPTLNNEFESGSICTLNGIECSIVEIVKEDIFDRIYFPDRNVIC